MNLKRILFLFSVLAQSLSAQYNDPNFAKPQTGYGSDGSHSVETLSFPNPNFPEKDIEIYHPSDVTTSVPTIFYSHAYGGNLSQNISGLLTFVAKKGYAIVFVPYQTTGVSVLERYDNLLKGFQKAAREYPSIIDTTRVGFLGHSFGGGASFGNAYTCFQDLHWGQNGRFIYALAQWYSYNIEQAALDNFPEKTQLLTEIFEDDTINDHRMAIDIFNNISIPVSEKDFLIVKSDTINGRVYAADHVLPNTANAFDALDYYAYYRFLDALCDYSFNGNLSGKEVALGNGSAAQITMPAGLKNIEQTDEPYVVYPEEKYLFPCSDILNPRKDQCPVITSINELWLDEESMKVTVNQRQTNPTLCIALPETLAGKDLYLFNSIGQKVLSIQQPVQKQLTISLPSLQSGIYLVLYGKYQTKFLLK
jgi:hypothetical protein